MGKSKQRPDRQAPRLKEQPALRAPRKKGGVVASSSALPDANTSDQRICWRFKHVDLDGRWGFDKITSAHWLEIQAKMADCESMTIRELATSRRLFKEYELSAIVADAVKRLDELQLGDLTKIHRLEFTGVKRLYGVLMGNVFHVIWWDPLHEICPSPLKHT